ncbi:MAG: hypothetical protein FWF59_11640 [Turicibacter sp.]|nr:hypothetical protein [Turicibacter sp.]
MKMNIVIFVLFLVGCSATAASNSPNHDIPVIEVDPVVSTSTASGKLLWGSAYSESESFVAGVTSCLEADVKGCVEHVDPQLKAILDSEVVYCEILDIEGCVSKLDDRQ